MGNANEVLYGNGTWGTLPNMPTLFWQQHGTDLYYMDGKVGIGTNTPLVSLDVIGDARVSNNLYVGGGVIITEKVNANAEVLTGALKADSIKMDSTKAVYGYSIFKDKVKLENKLQVDGDFKLNGSFILGNNKKISYASATTSTPEILFFGTDPIDGWGQLAPCITPLYTTIPNNRFNGIIQAGAISAIDGSFNMVSMGFDGANGILDIAGSNLIGGYDSKLLINYNCGKDVAICTNGAGVVTVGKNFEVGIPTRDVAITMNVYSYQNRTGMFLTSDHDIDFGYNTKLAVNRDKTKALAVFSNATNTENFVVYGDGTVGIGTNSLFPDYKLAVNGKIRAKELVIETGWSDFVFSKNYKLPTLVEVENYIMENQHLPEIPSATEIENNGGNVGELLKLQMQKIEELTLYLIEQNKKIILLQKEVEILKK